MLQPFPAYWVVISRANNLLCAKVLMGTLISRGAQIAYLHFKSSFLIQPHSLQFNSTNTTK